MEHEKIVSLLHEIAWPLVALFLAPFILRRLGALAKVYTAIADGGFVSQLADATEKLNTALATVGALEKRVQDLIQKVSALQSQAVEREFDEIQDVSASLSQRDEVERLQAAQAPQAPRSPEEMYSEMQDTWNSFVQTLSNKLTTIGKTLDARSVGTAAVALSDGRRARPLSREDVEFIANLHSQFKRFARLQASKEKWLSPEVWSTFLAGVAAAKEKILAT